VNCLIIKLKIMSKKMTKFQVEALEQRLEMSWVDTVVVGAGPGSGTGTDIGTGQTGVPIGEGTTPTPPPPPKN
jgi:hypothetical protein